MFKSTPLDPSQKFEDLFKQYKKKGPVAMTGRNLENIKPLAAMMHEFIHSTVGRDVILPFLKKKGDPTLMFKKEVRSDPQRVGAIEASATFLNFMLSLAKMHGDIMAFENQVIKQDREEEPEEDSVD